MTQDIPDGYLIFRAGKGEWYNQPHNKRWDMLEDVADIPPARWHVELSDATNRDDPMLRHVVVNATEFSNFVGQDWGFLARLSKSLASRGIKLSIIAGPSDIKIGKILKLNGFVLCGSLDELLNGT